MSIKQILAPIGSFVSLDSLVKLTGRKTIFPYYHTVSDVDLPYISNLYSLRSIDQFKKDLDFFEAHFTPIDIVEVAQRNISDESEFKPAFHLTFDDGLQEVYSIIAPILEERGIPATFFLNTDFIDNKALFYRYKVGLIIEKLKQVDSKNKCQDLEGLLKNQSKWKGELISSLLNLNYNDLELVNIIGITLDLDFESWLRQNTPYLTSGQISDLIERGFTIGSHSMNHPRFKNIEFDQQKKQIEGSFSFLKDHFNIQEKYFSFPFGDEEVRMAFFDWLNKECNCKLSFGVSGIKDDYNINHLHRIPMDHCYTAVKKYIKTEYLYFILKSFFNKNQIKRN